MPEESTASNERLIRLSDEEIVAARRLLSVLADEEPRKASDRQPDRSRHVEKAREVFRIRRRREELFGKGILGEPPYDMLLALYVNEDAEPRMPVTRLAELADIPHPTAVRWLDYLTSEGFVARETSATDKRKSEIMLLPEARDALDALFDV